MEEMEGLFGTQVDYLGLGSFGPLELDTADEMVVTSLMSEIFPDSFDEEIVQLQEDGLLNLADDHSSLPGIDGIEAFDVNGLLEQFEEASQTFGNCDTLQPSLTFDWNQNGPENMQGKENESKPSSSNNKVELTVEMIEKLKSCNKRKAAVLLPMGVPAKRGRGRAMARGRAVALPVSCTPLKLQKIMMQNSDLRDLNLSIELPVDTHTSRMQESKDAVDKVLAGKEEKVETTAKEKIQDVNENYFYQIRDHDYSKNVPRIDSDQQENAGYCAQEGCIEESFLNGDPEEGEIIEDGEAVDDETSIKVNKEDTQKSWAKKNYRKREEPVEQDSEVYFDKLPSYYTALSIPKKPTKKYVGEAISKNDFDRDPSPTRDSSVYDKLPDYYKCFTNSTKYDSKLLSSGYSSQSCAPVIDSEHASRSCSRSRRSRSRSRYSRERKRKRSRHSSYSSSSGSRSSSSSQSSSCSRSRSCYSSTSSSRSRSRGYRYRSRSSSRSYSRSRSRSYSRSCSRPRSRRKEKCGIHCSSTSRNSSIEREIEQQKELRHKEKETYKKRCIEERRIIYIGRLPNDYTRRQLRRRFERFGEIEDTRVHMREHGDNYGFVTFCYTCDAYAAIEKGNSIPGEPVFDLCFGGRRQFCSTDYADLDGNMEVEEEYTLPAQKSANLDFDTLLQQAKKAAKR